MAMSMNPLDWFSKSNPVQQPSNPYFIDPNMTSITATANSGNYVITTNGTNSTNAYINAQMAGLANQLGGQMANAGYATTAINGWQANFVTTVDEAESPVPSDPWEAAIQKATQMMKA